MLERHLLSDFGIAAIGVELPGAPIDIVDYAAANGVEAKLLAELLANGVRYFHDAAQRSDADLVAGAIEAICAERGSDWLAGVGYLIHARTQPFSCPAAPTSVLAETCARFGLAPHLAFGVEQLACAGVVKAIDMAMMLLRSDPTTPYALITTSDRVFGGPEWRLRQNAGVQTDAGTALLIGRDDLIVRFGPIAYTMFSGLAEGPSTPQLSAAIARSTPIQTKKSFERLAQACGRGIGGFARLLPINADRHYWVEIARYLGIGEDAFFLDNITRRGHALCGDLAINLVDGGLPAIRRGGTVGYCAQSNLGAYANIALCPPDSVPEAAPIPPEATDVAA